MQVPSTKTFLLIFAHPEPSSFCSIIKDKTIFILQQNNQNILLSDLYAMNFNPCISSNDFINLSNDSLISLDQKQRFSSDSDSFSLDISLELEKIAKADFLIFIAPMFWGSIPAIMKGWFDRVLTRGKAWDVNQWFETGLLKGKKAMLVITTASKKEYFKIGDFQNISLENMLHHINWTTFRFCGFEAQETYPFFGVGVKTKEELEKEIVEYMVFLENLLKKA